MDVIYKKKVYSSFLNWLPFISFSSQISWTELQYNESRHLFIDPDLRSRAFSLLPKIVMLAIGFIVFFQLRKFSLSSLLRVFIKNGYWILSNYFSALIEMIRLRNKMAA